jgi:branched-subunit amino acid aminotransferase/4-amino-4-deoxychorismate lyase
MKYMTAWINGQFLPFESAKLSIADSGLVHGDAVTEMLRTFGHRPFRVSEHLSRFRHSLTESLLECHYSDEELASIIQEVVSRSAKHLEADRDLGVILFTSSGPNVTYLGSSDEYKPTLCVHTFPLQSSLWQGSLQQGQRLVVSPHVAIPPESLDPTIKSRSRIHWRIADRRVKQTAPGASAVFADSNGHLTETSSGNLFAVVDDKIITPPDSVVLNGISRQVVIELATQLGYSVRKESLSIEWASQATEMWTSSTPYCLLPVTSLNQQPVGDGKPGVIFHRILDKWSEMVGVDIQTQIMQDC